MTGKTIAEISFFAEINSRSCSELIQAAEDAAAIKRNKISEIIVRLSSPGGDLAPAFQVYNYLRSLPLPLTMHNTGIVESSALLLFLAADTRLAAPHTSFLIHPVRLSFNGDITIRCLSNWLSRLESETRRYADIFNERTQGAQKPIDILKCLDDTDRWIGATEAAAAGICTSVESARVFPAGTRSRRYIIPKPL